MTLARLLILTALAVALAMPLASLQAQDDPLGSVTARQYIVIDAETGEVFAEKRGDGRAGMASVTKLFTLMEAVQRAPLDLEITVLETDLFGADSTKMTGFAPGVTFTLEDLLYGMMLESGNDAAYAIARGVGALPGDTEAESVDRFVGWINERAASLGLTNTQLKNPHGLSEAGHYTTPRDLSAFLMYGLGVEEFVRVMVARTWVTSTGVEIFSINRSPQFIPDQIGGKTGYDNSTGYCLAEVAERDGKRMIAVTFDGQAPDIWYIDQAVLFDFAYASLETRIAADQPLPSERVAFIAPGRAAENDRSVAGAEVPDPPADVASDPPIDAAVAAVVPTPARVDSLPLPSAVVPDRRSITGNWVLPAAIATGLIALMGVRGLGRVASPRDRAIAPAVDTSRPAS